MINFVRKTKSIIMMAWSIQEVIFIQNRLEKECYLLEFFVGVNEFVGYSRAMELNNISVGGPWMYRLYSRLADVSGLHKPRGGTSTARKFRISIGTVLKALKPLLPLQPMECRTRVGYEIGYAPNSDRVKKQAFHFKITNIELYYPHRSWNCTTWSKSRKQMQKEMVRVGFNLIIELFSKVVHRILYFDVLFFPLFCHTPSKHFYNSQSFQLKNVFHFELICVFFLCWVLHIFFGLCAIQISISFPCSTLLLLNFQERQAQSWSLHASSFTITVFWGKFLQHNFLTRFFSMRFPCAT